MKNISKWGDHAYLINVWDTTKKIILYFRAKSRAKKRFYRLLKVQRLNEKLTVFVNLIFRWFYNLNKLINVNQLRQAIREFLWDNRFANINAWTNEQLQLFTQNSQNIMPNYITHDLWWQKFTMKIKKLVLHKNRVFKRILEIEI